MTLLSPKVSSFIVSKGLGFYALGFQAAKELSDIASSAADPCPILLSASSTLPSTRIRRPACCCFHKLKTTLIHRSPSFMQNALWHGRMSSRGCISNWLSFYTAFTSSCSLHSPTSEQLMHPSHMISDLYDIARKDMLPPRHSIEPSVRQVVFLDVPELQLCNLTQLSQLSWAMVALLRRDMISRKSAITLLQKVDKAAVTLKLLRVDDCSRIAWSFAKLGLRDAAWFKYLAGNGCDLDWLQPAPYHLSRTLYAYALVSCTDAAPLFHTIVSHAIHRLRGFKPQDLSLFMWSLAALNKPIMTHQFLHDLGFSSSKALFQHIIRSAVAERVHDFSAHDVRNIMYACAKLGVVLEQPVVNGLLQTMLRRADTCKPQSAANALWALASLQQPVSKRLLHDLMRLMVQKAGECKPQDVVNATWASVVLSCRLAAHQMDVLRQSVMRQLDACTPQHIASLLWSSAKLTLPIPHHHLQTLIDHIRKNIHTYNGHDVCNIAWAMASFRNKVPGFLQLLTQHPGSRLDRLAPPGIASMLWSLATLEPEDHKAYFVSNSQHVLSRLKTLNAHGLSNVAWAYAVVVGADIGKGLLLSILQHAHMLKAELSVSNRRQLFSLMYVCQQQLQPVLCAEEGLKQLHGSCLQAWQFESKHSAPSLLQEDVFNVLCGMGDGLEVSYEYKTLDGLFCIDVVLRAAGGGGLRLAVEVDGPSHLTRSRPHQELGSVVLRHRMLEMAGWEVVTVSFVEWNALTSVIARQAFLRNKLQAYLPQQCH